MRLDKPFKYEIAVNQRNKGIVKECILNGSAVDECERRIDFQLAPNSDLLMAQPRFIEFLKVRKANLYAE